MDYKAIFFDIDGTLLDSEHKMLPSTKQVIDSLQKNNIKFAIVTARGPFGVRPLFKKYGFVCPMICYSGALIIDEYNNILKSEGMSAEVTTKVISYIESCRINCTWNIYAEEMWIVNHINDRRIRTEEEIIDAKSAEGSVSILEKSVPVGKIWCMFDSNNLDEIICGIKQRFSDLSICRVDATSIEIMANGVTKGSGVRYLCDKWRITTDKTIAFGDHYNDEQMLRTVGLPFIMGNAPADLKERFLNITKSNDDDGIYYGLRTIGLDF
ncbi:Cof-type HAD-IIB family hydrolase [Butyrivibrio sp. LC3010]|uniref:Cof-type HAD-IIB family hydrolase n=1 Tax=Butyrivibrio sp. LC3010 TaxID=1280680 RepID=UPI00047990B8|nr:Cof-type HAD-IIB family hydrolase [Butyrivibrio sp. LC3010]